MDQTVSRLSLITKAQDRPLNSLCGIGIARSGSTGTGLVFVVFLPSTVSVTPQTLHIHASLIYYGCYIILSIDSVVKQNMYFFNVVHPVVRITKRGRLSADKTSLMY